MADNDFDKGFIVLIRQSRNLRIGTISDITVVLCRDFRQNGCDLKTNSIYESGEFPELCNGMLGKAHLYSYRRFCRLAEYRTVYKYSRTVPSREPTAIP